MQEHHILHTLERIVREGLTQHAPLPAVDGLIDGIVGVVHALDGREGVIEVRLLESLTVPVDIMQALVRVDRDEVGGHPDVRAVLCMQVMQPEVSVTVQTMVQLDPGCDGSKVRSWNVAEGVEEAVIEDI